MASQTRFESLAAGPRPAISPKAPAARNASSPLN